MCGAGCAGAFNASGMVCVVLVGAYCEFAALLRSKLRLLR
jgi:hypothetical protein